MTGKADAEILRENELRNCSFVRAILMLAVVLYHAMLCWNGKWFSAVEVERNEILAGIANWLGTVHVYGFVLVSGYVFHFTRYERGKQQTYGTLLGSKARRLLIPYAFVSLVWVIPHEICFNGFDAVRLLRKYLLAESPQQLWFLWMLMIVFMIFGLLADYVRKYELGGLLVVGALYGAGYLGNALLPDVLQVWTGCCYSLYFWMGFKLRQHGTQLLRKLPVPVWLALHGALYLLLRLLPAQETFIAKAAHIGLSVLVNTAGGLMAFMVLQWLAQRFCRTEGRLYGGLRRYTMPVYLFHQQVVFWLILLLNGRLPSGVHALVNFTGALLISLGLAWGMMRFRTTRMLVGEK